MIAVIFEFTAAEGRFADYKSLAEKQGRAGIFRTYRLRIAPVMRDYGMQARGEAPRDSVALHG